MAQLKINYVCTDCGATYAKQVGRCFTCNKFNTVVEEMVPKKSGGVVMQYLSDTEGLLTPVREVASESLIRERAPGSELNRVLGGGIVPGSVILLGGEPGIGKSTLLLQTALRMRNEVVYVSGEESLGQIKMRADRIGIHNENCLLINETCVEAIIDIIKKRKPSLVIVDSIQTIYSKYLDATPGTVSQIRESSHALINSAKRNNVPVILVGHITKDGGLAGPKLLEHMVDTVLQFEGDNHNSFRILRALKNRFGSAMELGIYEMNNEGMREVSNPSEILLNQYEDNLPGTAVVASLEGMRPLLIETQALVSNAVFGNPQRNANGYDGKRLAMLLAVLETKCQFKLSQNDIFVNVAGGLKLTDPALDLGIAASIISAFKNIPIPQGVVFMGEIGLSGEVRGVSKITHRLKEVEKLGFKVVYLSHQMEINKKEFKLKIIQVKNITEFVFHLWD